LAVDLLLPPSATALFAQGAVRVQHPHALRGLIRNVREPQDLAMLQDFSTHR
jgi:hypothetical protein